MKDPAATATKSASTRRTTPRKPPRIAFPPPDERLSQDAEWCLVRGKDEWREIRLHDYVALYDIPGLYERVIYEILGCESPVRVCDYLDAALADADLKPGKLRVLDLGAGNGIVGEELRKRGAPFIVGVDIIEAAARAAERDRPTAYDNYYVADLTQLAPSVAAELKAQRLNCLMCVAALGFGDIPAEAFTAAFNLIEPGGWVAFNIKETFLTAQDPTGFAKLIQDMIGDRTLRVITRERYQHRIATDGTPLYYVGLVGRKTRDIAT